MVDVFAAPPAGGAEWLDLSSLSALCEASGGSLAYYNAGPAEAPLPRDLHTLLSAPAALQATLRLRCSPELSAGSASGCGAAPHPQHEGLFALPCVRPNDALAFDLAFASSEGFAAPSAGGLEQPPAVQLAFEYTVLLRGSEAEEAAEAEAEGGARATAHFVRQRRRRITTHPARLARSLRQQYEAVDAEAVQVLLTHKALRAAAAEGMSEARLMLSDWLGASPLPELTRANPS